MQRLLLAGLAGFVSAVIAGFAYTSRRRARGPFAWSRRDYSGRPANGIGQSETDALAVTIVMIQQAQARIDLLSQQVDGDDAKSLGFIAADLAAIGLILLLRSDLRGLWWIAAIGFLLSAGLLVGAA